MENYSSVVFLDIDGVLQPGTQKRFNYREDIPDLCVELERRPEIVSFAAVDDMNLELGLDGHAVCTRSYLEAGDLERLLSVLSLRDGAYPLPSECRTKVVMEFQKEVVPLEESEWLRKKPA